MGQELPSGVANYGQRLLAMALILGVNSFFAAAETALISVRPSRLKQMAAEGQRGAQAALNLLEHTERFLSTVQVGLTLASLALGWLGEDTLYSLLVRLAGPLLPAAALPALHIVSVAAAFALMTFAHVVAGEVVPKNLALERADRLAVLAAPALLVFYRLAEPFVWGIERTAAAISRWAGVRGKARGGGHSVEELKYIIRSSGHEGHLDPFEEKAIANLMELDALAAQDVMTPLNKLVMAPAGAGRAELATLMRESGYSRLPVYDGARDNLTGFVHAKDLLGESPFSMKQALRAAPIVPETKPLGALMEELRRRNAQIAFVVDEFGTITGLVTMEDVLEQVFGEIADEFDRAPQPVAAADGAWEVDGTINLRDLATQYGVELPEDAGYDTLAGFLMAKLGRVPRAGDAAEFGGRRFTVVRMQFNRVARVEIR